MGGLVMPWMEPLDMSSTVRVCAPKVARFRMTATCPLLSVAVTGVLAPASLEVMRMLSALGSGFQ
ncbi:MAG: hypothetical protein IFK94_16365 [Acidobacteria bacterium]|uniref:Uncharacterized protein n=1 Tax=Candidatus Polarisedimenticola svalbardensis TaxID=2886004 RepID=A0A8J6Y540_9BACT|nr:hypothetical protein [Candidatus Polarisedimenticola svalbardensis]